MIRDLSLELGATGDRRHQGRLHFELARLYEHPLRLLEQADREYRAALALRPEHLPTVRGARRVMLARGALRDALPLYEAEVLLVSDPSHKAALYYERGRLLEDHLGRVEEARAAYAQALELSPGDAALLSALDQRYTATQGWSRLDPILEEAANAVCADPHHRAAIVMRRARIAEWRLGQVDRAIELYEMALRIDPTANLAVRELQRLHRNQHRWRDLIRVLEFEGARLTDPAGKSLALAEAARIHSEQLGNRREAIAVMERALEHDPDNSEVLSGLSRLYEQTSQHALLAAMLERLAARTKDSRARAALFHRLGALHEERLGQDEQAVQWYDRALEIDPTSIPTLRALGSLHTRRSAWEPLVRILLAEASHAGDPERRATAHCRVANVLELRLEKTEDAIEQHLRALTSAPLHPPSFKALSRLLSAAGRWRQLVELHQRAVELAPDPTTAIAHLFKVGMIYEDWLDEPTQASHAFRRILELDPRHLGAVHALQRATERAGRYRELVLALELEAELLEDPARIVSLLHRAGEILLDELSDREGAVERFGRVLALDSSHRPALASLGRLHHAAGRWHELLEVYEQELALSESEDDSVLLLTKMGDLCRERLGREDDAIRHLRRAVSLDPTFVPAVESLTRLLLLREDFSELARVLELRLEALSDPDALSSTALRLGTLREDRLDDLRGAIAAYEQALRAQPESRAAIRALSRARARSGDFPELVRDLEREAKASLDPRMQNSIRMQAALLHSHRLDAPRVAISGLEAVIEEAPRQLTALLDLELLHRKGKSWEALVAVLQRLASVQADPVAKVATLRELIRIQSAHRVGTLEERISTYESLISILPQDPAANAGLEALALRHGEIDLLERVDSRMAAELDSALVANHRTRLGQALEAAGDPAALDTYRAALDLEPADAAAALGMWRMAEHLGEPEGMIEAARRMSEVAPDPSVASELLVRAASVRLGQLSDTEGAATDLERALELDPDSSTAATLLARTLAERGEHARLADLLARAAGSALADERAIDLWTQIAELQADALDAPAAAIASLERILKIEPNHLEALARLASLYELEEQWHDAATLLEQIIRLGDEPEPLRAARLRLALLLEQRLGDRPRAISVVQIVLREHAEDRLALERLSRLLEDEGHLEQAAATAERLLQASPGREHRASALLRVAAIAERRDALPLALEALAEGVRLCGPSSEPGQAFTRIARAREHWELYVEAIREFIVEAPSIARVAEAFLDLARIVERRLGDPERAIALLREGLEETAQNPSLRTDLAARLQRADRHEEAIHELEELRKAEVGRAETWRELARSYDALGRDAEARLARAGLSVLGEASPADLSAIRAAPPAPANAPPGTISAESLEATAELGEAERQAASLLRIIAPALPKLYPADLSAYVVSSSDRLTSRGAHPLRALADRIAAILGVGSFELYLHRLRGHGVSVELSSPTILLLPAGVVDLDVSEQTFLLARPLIHLALGFEPLLKLTPREFEVLLASACRAVKPDAGAGLTSEDLIDEQYRRLHRAMPRRNRKLLEEHARAYSEAGRVNFRRLCRRIARHSIQIAALIADDLPASIRMLRRTERELTALQGPAIVHESELVTELLRFWLSDEAMLLRRRTGMI